MAVLIGEATLNDAVLVDSLVSDVIDGLREDLHPQFGVRAYRVYVVRRTWTGRTVGQGQFSDVALELRPQPRVKVWDGLKYTAEPCGIEEMGDVQLSEVSLTYTERQLTGGGQLAMSEELLIGIAEAHGQGTRRRVYTHAKPPFIDREKEMGWKVWLRSINADLGAPWEP